MLSLSSSNLFFDLINLLITFITLITFRYYYLYFTRENPLPGPFPLPLVGSIFNINGDLPRYLLGIQLKYGDLFEVWFGSSRFIMTVREDYIEKFLSSSTKSKFMLRTPYKEAYDELD